MRRISIFLSCLYSACGTASSAEFDAELRARRDRDTQRLERGLAGESTFYLVKSLNRKCKEEFRTIHLFQTLDEKNPMLAKRCFHLVSDDLLNGSKAETTLFSKYAGDLLSYLQRKIDVKAGVHAEISKRNPKVRIHRIMQSLECTKLERLATKLADLAEQGGDKLTEDGLRRTATKIHLILGWDKPDKSLIPLLPLFTPR